MSRRHGIRVGSLIAALSICLVVPLPASAQHTARQKSEAIDAVTAYLKDVGETRAARIWVENWANGTYSFGVVDADGEVDAGTPNIVFSEQMIVQLNRGVKTGGPDRSTVGDWAATFMHELVHTRQSGTVYSASSAAHKLGYAHPSEAEAWGEGFKYYWKWMRISNARWEKARTQAEKEKYAREVIGLAESFKTYDANYRNAKLGPLPKDLRFEALVGLDSDPYTFEQALRETDKIIKKLAPTLHLAVKLSTTALTVRPGFKMALRATIENVWSPDSKKGTVRVVWKAGSKTLAERIYNLNERKPYDVLDRIATVDETITVIVSDDRSQKASASCQVTVRGPAMPADPTPQTAAPKTPTKPSKGESAWVQVDKRTNDWKERLDRQNKAMNGYWTHKMSVSDSSVTITNTYTGKKSTSWPKNGMSNTGTATWTPPSKTTIRSGDVVSVGLTTLNAPRDHANFGAVIFIKVETYRLGKDGKRTGSSSYFANENGKDVLGAGSPKGNQTKAPEAMTASRKIGAGAAEGDKMAICVTAAGETEMVQTEYIYEWKKF